MPLPLRVTGPVTCMTVDGNTVSLVYPITAFEPVMLFAPASMAIQITVAKGQNGEPNRTEPNRTGSATASRCPRTPSTDATPGPTPLIFDGTIDIH